MDNESTLDTLTPRLDRLERENRRLKIAGSILLLALVAGGAMGQVLPKAVPKVVEAERFVLRDTRGKIRAALDTVASGGLALSLADENGKARAGLGVAADGTPGLFLTDQNGKTRAELSVGTSGPSLVLRDENRDRAVLGHTALETKAIGTVEQRPASSLVLFDKNGKVIWRVP